MINLFGVLIWVLSEFALKVYSVDDGRDYYLLILKFSLYSVIGVWSIFEYGKQGTVDYHKKMAVAGVVFLWIFWELIASAWSPNSFVGFSTAVTRGFVAASVLILIIRIGMRQFLLLGCVSLGIIVILSILLYSYDQATWGVEFYSSKVSFTPDHEVYRARGLFGDPNGLGRACALLVYFLICEEISVKLSKYVRSIFFVSALFALYLSDSKTSLVALIISVLIYKTFDTIAPKKIVLWFLISMLFLAAVLYLFVDFRQIELLAGNMSRTGDSEEILTLSYRTYLWNFIVNKILIFPFGYGYRSAEIIIPSEWGVFYNPNLPHAHNLILDIAFNEGVIGLGIFFIVSFKIFRSISICDYRIRALMAGLVSQLTVASFAEVSISTSMGLHYIIFLVLAGSSFILRGENNRIGPGAN